MSKFPESDPKFSNPDQTAPLGPSTISPSDETVMDVRPSSAKKQVEIETIVGHAVNETLVTGSAGESRPVIDHTILSGSGALGPGQSIDQTMLGGSGALGTGQVVDQTMLGGSGVLASGQSEVVEHNATIARGGAMTAPVGRATQIVQEKDGLVIGEVFQGKYEIVKLIGAGGMGKVYQARHVDLDSMVAIKILLGNLSGDAEAAARFKREAQATARVKHPNAVQVSDYGVVDGMCYLVMEYLEGESLRQRMHRLKRMPLQDVATVVEQVCYVLEVMHRKGITHRDLKPDNIFCQQQEGMEILKVLDFGIAKVHATATHAGSDLTRENMMIGTPRYMSPEQCQGQPVDGRSDLYSLAVMIYEMVSGKVPFDAENPFSVALKHIHSPVPPITDIAPDVPPQVAEVIHKALSKPPNERYQSAKELSQAFCEAAMVQPTIKMELLAGSAPVDYNTPAGGGVTTAPPQEVITSGNTRPIGKMGGETLPFGSTDIGKREKESKLAPWIKYVAAAAALVILLGGGSAYFMNVREQERLKAEEARRIKEEEERKLREANNPLKNFVLIPGGTFRMGLDPGINDFIADKKIPLSETPAFSSNVNSFYLAKYEVTNAEYKIFIDNENYSPPKTWKDKNFPSGAEDIPVTNVSWDDAVAYCKWKSKKDSIEYRLPTEEEWEYGAKGNKDFHFPWGNYWSETLANCNKPEERTSTLPVNQPPNNTTDKSPFEIYGMAGNVSEWTASDFKLYPNSSFKPDADTLRSKIIRGGAFIGQREEARTTRRKWDLQTFSAVYLGFRLAANPPKG